VKLVNGTQEFMEAIRAGVSSIRLLSDVRPPHPIDLADYMPGHEFHLEGSGVWGSGGIYRGFDGPQPLFRASRFHPSRERHWSIRMMGLIFEPHLDWFPNAGPSLEFEHLQLSYMRDLRFQGHTAEPFIFGGGAQGLVNATDFERLYLVNNLGAGKILNASDFTYKRGAVEQHTASYGTGLVIQGPPRDRPNSYPSPGYIERVHFEFSACEISGVDDMEFVPGYHYWSPVRFFDCGGAFNFRRGGTWQYSEAHRDGAPLPLLVEPVT
jgi:hypothetical protein